MDGYLPLIACSLCIGLAGEVAKKLAGAKAGDRGWRGVYWVTFRWHGLAIGALIGLAGHGFGLPVPDAFGDAIGGSVLAYTFAGALAMVAYETLIGTIKNWIRHAGERS